MNHLKIYNKIIENAKVDNRIKHNGIYYESHHINPKCLGGTNDKENLVLLTAKEHFICHKLLTYIHKNYKIVYAFKGMFNHSRNNKRYYNLSSRDYSYLKELISKLCSGENSPLKGIKKSEKTKNKMKKPKSELHKKHMSDSQKGRIGDKRPNKNKGRSGPKPWLKYYPRWNKGIKNCYSKETLDKMNIAFEKNKKLGLYSNKKEKNGMFGKESPMKGKHHTKEVKEKIRLKALGRIHKKILCIFCNREISDNNYYRYHGEKCKFK